MLGSVRKSCAVLDGLGGKLKNKASLLNVVAMRLSCELGLPHVALGKLLPLSFCCNMAIKILSLEDYFEN